MHLEKTFIIPFTLHFVANLVHLVFLTRFNSISSAQVLLEHQFPEHGDQDLKMSFTFTPDFLTLQAVVFLQFPSYATAFITAAVFWQVNPNMINKVFSIMFISTSCDYNRNDFFTPIINYQVCFLLFSIPLNCSQFCLGRFLRLFASNST